MRITLAVAVACLTMVGFAAADNATAAVRKTTEIPAQGLGPALTTLAKEFDFQVLYRTEVVGTLRTQGASGAMTAAEALEHVLNGTGLTYKYLDDKTVTIMPVGTAASSSNTGGGHDRAQSEDAEKESQRQGGEQKKSFWDRFRLAQAAPSSNSGRSPQSSALGTRLAQANTVPTEPEVKHQQEQPKLEEIIVTAQRRAESLQDVPLSVAAYDQADIQSLAISGIDDIVRLTPGLGANYAEARSPSISIRGIYTDFTAGASTTGVYIDDTPIQARSLGSAGTSASAFPTVFDLDRIEVLRGPQGTLFGAGSEGGAVRFITPDPSFTEYTGRARAEYGFNQQGAPSNQLGVAVGGPLVPGALAFRLSAYEQEDGGWIDRAPYPLTYVADKNVNWVRTTTVNGALAWAVTDNLSVTLKVFFQDLNSGGPPEYWSILSNPSSGNFVNGALNNMPTLDQFTLPSLKVEWSAGPVTLISNTSDMNRTRSFTNDVSVTLTQALTDGKISPETSAPKYTQNPQHEFTQEIRLQSTDSHSALKWVVGGFYQRLNESAVNPLYTPDADSLFETLFGVTTAQLFGSPLLPGGLLYIDSAVSQDIQKAAFAQVDIRLFDKLTATAGLRYSKTSFSYMDSTDGPLNGGPSGTAGRSSASASTPKFGLDYKATEGLMFYTSAAKGFRPGATNAPIPSSFCAAGLHAYGFASEPLTYEPDYVWSYEVGSKGELLQHRLLWDVSVYDVNWKNKQTTLGIGGQCGGESFIANLGGATSKGFDLDVKFAASEHITIGGSLGYDDAEYSKSIAEPGAAGNIVTKGEPLPTPPWHGFVSADYQFTPLPNKARMYMHLDESYSSGHKCASPQDANFNSLVYDCSGTVNILSARLGIRRDSWDVSLFAKNLLDAHPSLSVATNSATTSTPVLLQYLTLPPRVIGITMTYKF